MSRALGIVDAPEVYNVAAHQDGWMPNKIHPTRSPDAAGLKICLPESLTKFFTPIAAEHITRIWYHEASKLTIRAIISPVIMAEYGIKKIFLRKNVNNKSANTVKPIHKTKRYNER